MNRSRNLLTAAATAGLVLVATTAVASASWTSGSDTGGRGSAAATGVDPGLRPTAVAAGGNVTVSWAASTLTSGAPVSGYRITRYDVATTAQPTTGECAGVVAALTCTEASLPDGQWTYTVTPVIGTRWTGAESPRSIAVTTDSGVPVNAITTTALTGNAVQNGGTVYYRGVAAGSFTLTNTLTDTSSGPESSRTAALVGDVSGWTHVPSTVSQPAGGPFVANPFSWAAATTSTVTETVTGSDAAGNHDITTLSFVDDSTPPAGGSVSYPDGYQAQPSVTVTFAAGTDAGSGLGSSLLQRSDAVLNSGVCAAFSAFANLGAGNPESPLTDTSVADGHCYAYRYVVTDRVGNQATYVTSSIAKIDQSVGGPRLGRAGPYSVLAVTAVDNTGPTTITGDVGVSPNTTVSGFPPGTINGNTDAGNGAAAAAQVDLTAAYAEAAARPSTAAIDGDLIGRTFTPGTYRAGAAIANTGILTLDGQGDANSLFVFQIGAALNTAELSTIVLINGAQASHIFWQVLGAVGTGANSTFAGTILAQGAITLGAGARLTGRALSKGTVTLSSNAVAFSTATPPVISIDGGSAAWTRNVTPTIGGTTTATPGRTVTVQIAGQTLTAIVQAGGTWNVTASVLPAGDYPVRAVVRDPDGNAGGADQVLTVEVNPTPVVLGSAATYSVLAGTAVTNTLATTLTGDLGVSPGSTVGGFPPGLYGGTLHVNDATAALAQSDLTTAYNDAAGRPISNRFSGDQIGTTYHEGVYNTPGAFTLTGKLTLDAQGDANANFVIQVGGAMDVAALAQIVLKNGAQASHVYWQIGGAVTAGAGAAIVGTLMCAAVTLGLGTRLVGRVLSKGGVTLATNIISAG